MTIRYSVKNVFGINRFYVNQKAQAKAIKMITGHKTLTFEVIQGLQMLGIKFKQVLDPADSPPSYPCADSIDSIQ